jgi:hypothetical protein
VAEAASFSSDAGSIAHGKLSPAARLKRDYRVNSLISELRVDCCWIVVAAIYSLAVHFSNFIKRFDTQYSDEQENIDHQQDKTCSRYAPQQSGTLTISDCRRQLARAAQNGKRYD